MYPLTDSLVSSVIIKEMIFCRVNQKVINQNNEGSLEYFCKIYLSMRDNKAIPFSSLYEMI